MSDGEFIELRREYHRRICDEVLRINSSGIPNNADSGSRSSVAIGKRILEEIDLPVKEEHLAGQTAGHLFEKATCDFLDNSFQLLNHLRPGNWTFSLGGNINEFEQYRHLQDVLTAIEENKSLRVAFGDYIVRPDIVVYRSPVENEEINKHGPVLGAVPVAKNTPLRQDNSDLDILHASVSCKWTIRSDRSQNARTEGLNLARNRKGRTPHIVVVTGEPLPGRIASLAIGTGDIDCVYHFALPELVASVAENDSDADLLHTLIQGKRLRDISDLPFDLAI